MSDIGARFVACKGWRWMPGMRLVEENCKRCGAYLPGVAG